MDTDDRTARTNISRSVFNPANTTQGNDKSKTKSFKFNLLEYELKVILPKTGILTNISIDGYAVEIIQGKNESSADDGDLDIPEYLDIREAAHLHRNGRSFGHDWDTEAEQGIHQDPHEHHRYQDAEAEEGEEQLQIEQLHNGHHLYNQDHLDPADLDNFMLFALPVNIGPRQNVTMCVSDVKPDNILEHSFCSRSVIYVEELEINNTRMTMDMFLCPEEILHNFSVEVDIKCEEDTILGTEVGASVLGDINNETLEEISEKRHLVNFTMNTREQAHYFGSSGFFGTLSLQVKTAKSETILEYPNEYEIAPLGLRYNIKPSDRIDQMCNLSVCMISSFLSPGSSLSLTQIMRDHNKTTIVAYDDLVQEYWNNGLHN